MTIFRFSRAASSLFLVLLAASAAAPPASAASFDNSVEELSSEIATYLRSQGVTIVKVGTFNAPPNSSAGVAVRNEISRKLAADGLRVDKRASIEVRGRVTATVNSEDPPAVLVHAVLVDSQNSEMVVFQHRPEAIATREDVAQLLSVTADLSVDKELTAAELKDGSVLSEVLVKQDESLRKSIVTPQFHQVDASILAASADSPYHMELLLRDGDTLTPVPLENFEGQAYANLPQGREYVVRLHNNSDIDVGVKLMIDGVNSLELTRVDAYRELGMWIIKARSTGTVQGWHVENSRSLAFLVVDAPKSEAARLGRDQIDIGTITASFVPAWTGETPPREELFGSTRLDFGTAAGAERRSEYRQERRVFGSTLLATVSVRYEKPDPPNDLPEEIDSGDSAKPSLAVADAVETKP